MNVVELCGISRNAGGLYYAMSSLCSTMQASGKASVQVFGADDRFVPEDRAAWGLAQVIPYKAYTSFHFAPRLGSLLERSGAELVHQHGLWLDDQRRGLLFHKKTGCPLVVSPHGMLDAWALSHSAWKKKLAGAWFAKESLMRAGCIHALCQSEAESIRAYGISSPVAVIPNGVHLPELQLKTHADRSRPMRLLYLGRLHEKKAIKELILAWKKVVEGKNGDWELVIAGWDDGGYESGLKELVRQSGLSSSVQFVGAQFGDEKEHLFRNVDAFILPSFSEGLPVTVLEAWSYGLPVIKTTFCNLPEGFEAGAAICVEPQVDSIAEGLSTMMAMSPEDLDTMGMKGRWLVESGFSWEWISEMMLQVYAWVLGHAAKPGFVTGDKQDG